MRFYHSLVNIVRSFVSSQPFAVIHFVSRKICVFYLNHKYKPSIWQNVELVMHLFLYPYNGLLQKKSEIAMSLSCNIHLESD